MHLAKAGTPTMGGVALVAAAVVGYLMGHAGTHVAFSRPGVLVVAGDGVRGAGRVRSTTGSRSVTAAAWGSTSGPSSPPRW